MNGMKTKCDLEPQLVKPHAVSEGNTISVAFVHVADGCQPFKQKYSGGDWSASKTLEVRSCAPGWN